MSASISQTESQELTVLRAFLIEILPASVVVIRAGINRVPEPIGTDFVVMTPIMRPPLSTNVETSTEIPMTASIAGTLMTVTALVGPPAIAKGMAVSGAGVAVASVITTLGTGTGGIGTYTVKPSQTVASGSIFAGTKAILRPTEYTVQLDVHGPASADNAQIISTLLRDNYACDFFTASSIDMQTLYASGPRQLFFNNGEQQYEERWIVDSCMQINPVVSVAQQFAGTVDLGLINVDVTYPP